MGKEFWINWLHASELWLGRVWTFVNLPLSHRFEVTLMLAAILIAAVIFARYQIKILKDLNPDFLIKQFPGASPQKKSSIKKRIAKLEKYQNHKTIETIGRLLAVIVLSIAVPAAIFIGISLHYSWFFPGHTLFIDATNSQQTVPAPSISSVTVFIIDQILRAPSDAAEIFGLRVSHIAIAPHTYLADAALLFFRTFAGGAIYSIIYSTYLLIRALFTPNSEVEKWRKVLARMETEDAQPA